MNPSESSYQNLYQLSRNTEILSSISQLLDWDQETYMPPDANGARSEQQKVIAGLIHTEKTSKQFTQALEKLIDIPTGTIIATDLTEPQKAALKMWRRDYLKDTALPAEFVQEFAQLSSHSQSIWRKAKKEQSFEQFAPFLDKLISMNKKKAEYLTYKEHPYDALLDLYEPEMTTKETSKLFSSLETSISSLLKKIGSAPQVDDAFLYGNFDHKKQLEFGLILLNAMGFSRSQGRLDISTHPFSASLHPTDNRITTRIHTSSLMSNISSILHEAGHALYGMGLPEDQYGSPLGQPISYGIHESQSRWWETRIGTSKPFWNYYYPLLQSVFPETLKTVDLETFYKGINKVRPSLIRVEADEVGYPLHVILRFNLERDLIDGTLSVRDIPEAWNSKMKELIGVTPENNSEGCLQDIHWAMGAFGYFPSYALGNIYASHLFPTFEEAHPDWKETLATGNLQFIKEWLNKNVHQYGRQYTSIELMNKITKRPFTAEAYINYLNSKYSEIYSLKG